MVPRAVLYKLLDEDLKDVICYVQPGDNSDKQCCITLSQQVLEQTFKCSIK